MIWKNEKSWLCLEMMIAKTDGNDFSSIPQTSVLQNQGFSCSHLKNLESQSLFNISETVYP